jgi:Ca-activated chloride channel family protein
MVRSVRSCRSFAILLLGIGLALVLPFVSVIAGQGAQVATLTGTVVDNVGAVPGATVTATHLGTSRATSAITNEQGTFRIAALEPGRYTARITMTGFKQLDVIEFELSAGAVRDLGRLTLVAGGTTESVSVTAEVTPVQTTSSGLQRNLTGDVQNSVQVKGRDIFGMLQTLPGTTDSNQARDFAAWSSGRSLSINAGNSLNSNTTIDGVPVGEHGNGQSYITPNIDSLAEVMTRSANGRERYARIAPNPFNDTKDEPLSTFGADVDTASYANVRRFLSGGSLPPPDAVRVEELINYFRFDYAQPRGSRPVAVTTEVGECPWAPGHKLVLIGTKAKASLSGEIEGRNIVLLLDVSGSMAPAERLPLLKTALAQFVDTLAPTDRIAIVTYAGTSGLALRSTPAAERETIQRAIASLNAGGSTNGASGIVLAYQVARENFIRGGVNRVILATDGDFNVGMTNQNDLWKLIERERTSGVFLSVFGVGSGNLNDAMMEQLADRGNGRYSYLDSLQEARRVLVREGAGTLETVAKDVKFQVEFNPNEVTAWRLIGYENRRLAAEDFNDDRKDAGDVGAGHTVTVLYEIVPAGVARSVDVRGRAEVDPLRYQQRASAPAAARSTRPTAANPYAGEWLTVKVRYKAPDSDQSQLIVHPVRTTARPTQIAFASAVAEFGMLLRYGVRNDGAWDALSRRVQAIDVPRALIADKTGFEELVEIARSLSARR